MTLCITPDRDVYRYADDTTADLLQHLYDDDYAVLHVQPGGLYGELEVREWLGATGDAPAVGWARIEHKIE